MKPLRTLLCLSLLLTAGACAVGVQRFEPATFGAEHVVRRDWQAGTATSVVPGGVVARFLEGRARRIQSGWATATQAFTASSGGLVLRGHAGERFEVRGTTEVNGRDYLAVDAQGIGGATYSLLLDGRGRISERALRGMELLTERFTVAPAGAVLELEVIEEFEPGAPFRHRELVFAGVLAGQLTFEVREYGPGGTGEATSMSRLTFPPQPGTIEVGGWTVRVDAVTPAALECAVVADSFVQG
jgi:hypothetical protein